MDCSCDILEFTSPDEAYDYKFKILLYWEKISTFSRVLRFDYLMSDITSNNEPYYIESSKTRQLLFQQLIRKIRQLFRNSVTQSRVIIKSYSTNYLFDLVKKYKFIYRENYHETHDGYAYYELLGRCKVIHNCGNSTKVAKTAI